MEEQIKKEEFRVTGNDVLRTVKKIIRDGNARKISIKDDKNQTVMEIPLTFAIVGAVLAPILAAVGALAALMTRCTIVVERKE